MRIAVLCSPDSWYFQDICRAAKSLNLPEPVGLSFSRIGSQLTDDGECLVCSGDRILNHFDAILVRTMPPGSLEQVVFRMDALARLEASGVPVFNPSRAIETAVDKYLTSARLHAAGLPTPPIIACQTFDDAMSAFIRLGSDVVVKPLFGGEGRGLMRVDEALALRTFKTLEQLNVVIYLQPFIAHEGYDIRLLVIGEQVLAMRRSNPNDWRTNVSRGAHVEPVEVDSHLIEMAQSAAKTVGAPLAGVDILTDLDGRQYILEVNAVPGWKALARVLNVDVAAEILKYIARSLTT